MTTLANKYRPIRFDDVVGQDDEKKILMTILQKGWKPPAIQITGPFGTGKTTLARLLARALLCDDREGVEPCGACVSCRAMDRDNNPGYTEVDAASQGLVGDVRNMKDFVSYSTSGEKPKIICYDESHMLSTQAQNALLQVLEEGAKNTLFIFCTTESHKMLPTITSRSVILRMKLLTVKQIADRLQEVAKEEKIALSKKGGQVMATYVRGHVRDALVLLEQLSRMADDGVVDEDLVRSYLRLDRYDDIYKLLIEEDQAKGVEELEALLCDYAVKELTELAGNILLNAYKVHLGITNFTQTDLAWLKKVFSCHGTACLSKAEQILSLPSSFASITYAEAAIGRILWGKKLVEEKEDKRSETWQGPTAVQLRKKRDSG